MAATARQTVGFNVNANDAKIRDSRFQRLGLTGILSGANHLIVGNHWFQGDEVPAGPRVPGMVFTYEPCETVVTGNYIDNCYIEWTNEHDARPDFGSEYSFGGLTVTGNIFLASDCASHTRFIVVKPYGTGHFLNGVTVSGNKFRSILGTIDRAERVDTSFAGLDMSRTKNLFFDGNSFHSVTHQAANPLRIRHDQATAAETWVVDPQEALPFAGEARGVDAIVALGAIRNAASLRRHSMPHVELRKGPDKDRVHLVWDEAMRGEVALSVRIDA